MHRNLIINKLVLSISSIFLLMTLYVLFCINFWPEGLTANWQIGPASRYYKVALDHHILAHLRRFNLHILTATIMLLIGTFQFFDRRRHQRRERHKILGLVYLGCGLLSLLSIVLFSENSIGGVLTQSAAISIAVIWGLTAASGLRCFFRKDYRGHGMWMTRNYCMTLATFFIRPIYIFLSYSFPQIPLEQVFPISFWLCLVVALLLAQWILDDHVSRLFSNHNNRSIKVTANRDGDN